MKKEICLEEKLYAIGIVFQGESARSVSRKLHLNRNKLYEWLSAYEEHGIQGLITKKRRTDQRTAFYA
jgi:transposase